MLGGEGIRDADPALVGADVGGQGGGMPQALQADGDIRRTPSHVFGLAVTGHDDVDEGFSDDDDGRVHAHNLVVRVDPRRLRGVAVLSPSGASGRMAP